MGLSSLDVEFQNPYGKLQPEYFPLYKATSILCIVYGVMLVIWMVTSFQHGKHLVALQNYIGLVLKLSMLEMAISYAFYFHYNETGQYSQSLMFFVAIASALRGTATLFFLLLTCMGYGVVM